MVIIMSLMSNIVINAYSVLLLIILCFHSVKNSDTSLPQDRLYRKMLLLTISLLILDVFSRFDGHPGTYIEVINRVSNFLVFFLNPLIPTLWAFYVYFQIGRNETGIIRWLYGLAAVNVVNFILLIFTQFTGWYYTIDSNNVYHRGPLFILSVVMTTGIALTASVVLFINRHTIEKKKLISLLSFPLFPILGTVLQTAFYGISIVLNSIVLALLIIYLNIQNQNLNTDYLTGAYNRKWLEDCMKCKIKESSENRTFSAILIDLDHFKFINDTYGHDVGDFVLETSVNLLKNCLRNTDRVARFGGDEFYIILDISALEELEAVVRAIDASVEKYNRNDSNPFKLGFSIGYAVYDYSSHQTVDEFQKQIDDLMYEKKRDKKEVEQNGRMDSSF